MLKPVNFNRLQQINGAMFFANSVKGSLFMSRVFASKSFVKIILKLRKRTVPRES